MKNKLIYLPAILIVLLPLFYCGTSGNNEKEFAAINIGLKNANNNITIVNDQLYANFEKAKLNDELKNGKIYADAMRIRAWSKQVYSFIENEEKKISLSDADIADLKKQVNDYRSNIMNITSHSITIGLNTDSAEYNGDADGIKDFQSNNNIEGTAAMLALIKQSIAGIEFNALNHLFMQINISDFKFDSLAAVVIPEKNVVNAGEDVKAEIFVSATNTTSNPLMWLCNIDPNSGRPTSDIDSTSIKVNRGVGHLTLKATGAGKQNVTGLVRVKAPDYTWRNFPFSFFYEVNK
ncbi:MAG: hypothetical protein HY064_17135 [Bacteroidetes bacterium]|nr:hypothetical protein [Bacteroidota bacterium]